jgi:hypothetical protein
MAHFDLRVITGTETGVAVACLTSMPGEEFCILPIGILMCVFIQN